MVNLEYHKGHDCVYKPILCQEGWCSECSIYQQRHENKRTHRTNTFVTFKRQAEHQLHLSKR